MRRTYISW